MHVDHVSGEHEKQTERRRGQRSLRCPFLFAAGALVTQSNADCRSGFRPDPALRVAQPLDQTPVARQKHTDPMLREPGLGHEVFNISEEIVRHACIIARYRVSVNARYNVHARYRAKC